MDYTLAVDMPDDFAMNQPLSPFLIAALELLDPDSPSYALDVVSMVEATLENPRQILRVQEKKARDEAMLRMKDEGLDYDERMEKLQTITYPQPLKELLMPAFSQYLNDMPWAADYQLEPKSIVRDMVERSSDFTQYIAAYGVPRSEGNLLRYLSDAYRALSRTVPPDKVDQTLGDITQWLGYIVRTVDSSLVDEWEDSYADQGKETNALTAAPPTVEESIVANRRALTLLVRNALFRRVQLMAIEDSKTLGGLDSDFGYNQRDWDQVLDDFYQDHEEILTDADARSLDYFILDESEEKKSHRWHVRQVIRDFEGDNDWAIDAQVDLAATQEEGQVVFSSYRVGRSDELI